jgi:hypothetical protein
MKFAADHLELDAREHTLDIAFPKAKKKYRGATARMWQVA